MSNLERLFEKYEGNRVIRGLIQLVPFGIGGALDVVLTKTLDNIREERAVAFFDELAKGDVVVDERLLESEDFLHAYFATTRYALNSRKREKITMFARLLKSSLTENDIANIDEYEDFLKILDELSYRELLALKIFDEYSSTPRTEEQKNDLQWTNQFWDEFEQRLAKELNIPTNQVIDFMNRIARTGCYEIFTGYFGGTDGKGKLTPTYHHLKKFVEGDK